MAFELIVIFALVVVFIVSFCGLIQKIRHSYERERERERSGTITISEIYITGPGVVNRACSEVSDTSGVFPSAIAPPPYIAEYQEPPPKYDDIIKSHIIQPGVHQPHLQSSVPLRVVPAAVNSPN